MEALRAGFYLVDGTLDLKDASDGLRNQGHERNLNVEDLQISQLDRQLSDDACHVLRHSVWIIRTVTKYFSCAVNFRGDVFTNTKTTSLASTDPEYLGQDQYEYESSFRIRPARYWIKVGLSYDIHVSLANSSIRGWKYMLVTFRLVPDDAAIFELCRQGNLPAVRSLLSQGHAAVRDTDSRGYTPLHASSRLF